MRIGRGIGSGKGKTGGRGGKGQTARSGVAIKGFEGGQMPLHRRLPKRGFTNIFAVKLNEVNLGRVQIAIDQGELKAGEPITADALVQAGVLRRAKDGVRLLGGGEIKVKLAFEVYGASKSAAAAVEKLGGSVKLLAPPKPERKPKEKPAAKAKPEPQAKEAKAKEEKPKQERSTEGKPKPSEGKPPAPKDAAGETKK
jgi:large subunit ribosomal protein L15